MHVVGGPYWRQHLGDEVVDGLLRSWEVAYTAVTGGVEEERRGQVNDVLGSFSANSGGLVI
jgi:hypothetical protein